MPTNPRRPREAMLRRRDKVRELIALGATTREMMEALGATRTTIRRDRAAVSAGYHTSTWRQREAQARREKVKALAAEGVASQEMAQILGVTERTVQRDRAALGLTHRNVWIWTPEMEQLARNLLEDQCPYTEVARTIGCNQWTVMTRFPGYGRVGNPLGNGRHMRLADELGLGLCNYNPRGQITA